MDQKELQLISEIFEKQRTEFQQAFNVAIDRFEHKLAIVAESVQILAEKTEAIDIGQQTLIARFDNLELKVDHLESRFDNLEQKVDGLAGDLSAHRADTEAHHGVYRVKES